MKDGLAVSIPGAYAQVARLPELAVLAEEASWDGLCVQDGFLSLVAHRVGVSRGQQGCHSALQRFAHRCIA